MNDNYPLPNESDTPSAFATLHDSYALYFDDWQSLDLLNDAATAREWQNLPRWHREQFERLIPKPPIVVRDKPLTQDLYYIPNRGDYGGYLTVASWQPHHRETAETPRSDIIFIDGDLAPAEDWHLPENALRNRPIILCRPGDHLLANRTAVELALEGELCAVVEGGRDLKAWQRRLLGFELIFPKRINLQ
jgi:hypothetical protein